MSRPNGSPGPLADETFDRGFRWATLLGVAGVGVLGSFGVVSPFDAVHMTLVLMLFPVYLVFVSVLLGVWLGYDTDETNLQRVSQADPEDPWERWR